MSRRLPRTSLQRVSICACFSAAPGRLLLPTLSRPLIADSRLVAIVRHLAQMSITFTRGKGIVSLSWMCTFSSHAVSCPASWPRSCFVVSDGRQQIRRHPERKQDVKKCTDSRDNANLEVICRVLKGEKKRVFIIDCLVFWSFKTKCGPCGVLDHEICLSKISNDPGRCRST